MDFFLCIEVSIIVVIDFVLRLFCYCCLVGFSRGHTQKCLSYTFCDAETNCAQWLTLLCWGSYVVLTTELGASHILDAC